MTQEDLCEAHCYLNDICQSIKISPRLDNGQWRCELNDAVDPKSLVEADEQKFIATKVNFYVQSLSM